MKSSNRQIKKVDTREFNKLLRDGFNGYIIFKNRKIMVCISINKIKDIKKRQMSLWKERRERYDKQGLCHMCGKYKIAHKSKSRCKKCLRKAREYNY